MSRSVSPARAAAIWVLSRCRRFDAWTQQTADSARTKFSLSDRDAALCLRLCRSVLQNAALLDWYISKFCSRPPEDLDPAILDILRLGAAQLLLTDRIPASAAVNESVELAKRGSPGAAGLVNAVLRSMERSKNALPDLPEAGTPRELSIRFSHPLWLCERLVSEYGYENARAFLEADNTPPDLTVTANLCRTDAVSLLNRFRDAGLDAALSPLSEISIRISAAGSAASLPGYAEGEFFVQDAAASTGVIAAHPEPGMRVLDLCSAPGGKSMLCAVLMRDRGEILSCDLHAKKLSRVEENAARLGLKSIRTMPADAADPPEELRSAFDLVIADAPCSGLGVIRKKPEIRYKSPEDIAALPAVQLRILRGAAGCVKRGGTLLYSTCTVLREENEEVTEAYLSEDSRFSLIGQRTIRPHEFGTDGFYYAVLRRS